LVDGVVLAQPLFASNAKVKGVRQPVLIIATSNNDVYAFSPLENRPVPLWHRRIDAPLVSGEGHAACVPNELAAWQEPGTFSAGGLDGLFGIESTPVIDATNNRVLVSYKTADSVQHLAALDLNDGSIIKSSGSISCKRVAPPASKPSKLASFGRRRLRRFFEFMRGNTYSNARLD
jgi:hypothetical protein